MKREGYEKALITGASSGLGQEYATQLAQTGTDLILVARRHERLKALATGLSTSYGVKIEVLPADLSQDEDLEKVVLKIRQTCNLDLLINNAGFGGHGKFHLEDGGEAERMIKVHVLATTILTRAALPSMLVRHHGAIINVASVAAFSPLSGTMYSSTKAFEVMFSENLQSELYDTGLKVQALCPGLTHTEFHQVAGIKAEAIPGMFWMKAEDVVKISLRALSGHKVIIVPGTKNKLMTFFLRCPWTFALAHWAARQKKIRHIADSSLR
ncbi:MAG TPA: SDR family oxidoreductase [Candidatus Saccharicenans sp.]|nr:SDR family oxidoreductase [Candidatus Saccharicenans sp.]HRD01553.1 SDR family oxidoreductase [Candidatus Saccharicenans sp.]